MNISAINNTSFGKIYTEDANYSRKQANTIKYISDALKTGYESDTTVKLLEQKGYDVLMKSKDDDKVSLSLLRNFKFNDKDLYPKFGGDVVNIHVADYDYYNGNSISDIFNKIKEHERSEKISSAIVTTFTILLMALMFTLGIRHNIRQAKPIEKAIHKSELPHRDTVPTKRTFKLPELKQL